MTCPEGPRRTSHPVIQEATWARTDSPVGCGTWLSLSWRIFSPSGSPGQPRSAWAVLAEATIGWYFEIEPVCRVPLGHCWAGAVAPAWPGHVALAAASE